MHIRSAQCMMKKAHIIDGLPYGVSTVVIVALLCFEEGVPINWCSRSVSTATLSFWSWIKSIRV